MSELRENFISREWVIIAPERARRPDQYVNHTDRPQPPERRADCPFCPGNEGMTPGETLRFGADRDWQVRSVPNKYPALKADEEKRRSATGLFRAMTGFGVHEVIVEHPRHNAQLALMTEAEVGMVIRAYIERYRAIRRDPRIETIIIFKNHGERAGTSIEHPHSQMIATPIVPPQVRIRLEQAIRYYDAMGNCVFCDTLKEELAAGQRIICQTEHFAAFIPYAALSPFHTWIFPKRHRSCFSEISGVEAADLAGILRRYLKKLSKGLANPDFNFTIRSNPVKEKGNDYFHWYISLVPRVGHTAGFEIGSGMFVNSTLPEVSAAYLRDIDPDGKA